MRFVIEAKNTSGMNSPFLYEAVVNKNILYCNSAIIMICVVGIFVVHLLYFVCLFLLVFKGGGALRIDYFECI